MGERRSEVGRRAGAHVVGLGEHQRRPDVVDHGVERGAPLVVRRPPVARVERAQHQAAPAQVADAGLLEAVGGGQLLDAELADRLQGAVAGAGAAVDEQQALLGQAGQAVGDGGGVASGEGGRRGDVEPAGEHADRAQQGAVVVVEQVVAPRDGVAQRAVAVGDAAAGGQEAQALVEPGLQPVESERRAAGGGQLDRQRHAVEGPAQHGDARGVDELRAGCRGAGHEQARRHPSSTSPAPRRRARTASAAGPGWWPGRARRDSAARMASRQSRTPSSRCSQLSTTSSSARRDERRRQGGLDRRPVALGDLARLGDRGRDHRRIADVHEVDEHDAVGEAGRRPRRPRAGRAGSCRHRRGRSPSPSDGGRWRRRAPGARPPDR